MRCFAHSLSGTPDQTQWEPLKDHLQAVAARARALAQASGFDENWAEAAGLLHDIGKVSDAYQRYIRGLGSSPDHSTAGAVAAEEHYGRLGWLLAFVIAGHHAGLADGITLKGRLAKRLENYAGWETHTGTLPALVMPSLKNNPYPYFALNFFVRMLFSCLVDADFLETEAFYARATNQPVSRGNFAEITALRTRLAAYMDKIAANATPSPINEIRRNILDHAIQQAALPPGLFTMTVPTGGGKTLASLSFALEHAAQHGLRRVIYVAPYTSIIEQTASVFANAVGAADIVEHHSNFDVSKADETRGEQDGDGLKKLRQATENWDAPIIVTTAVQFFESLYAARSGACRKLHNIAQSVVILDEAQTLPLPVLRPCLAALTELTLNYGASVVLCTATQPPWGQMDQASTQSSRSLIQGFEIGPERELAPEPETLFTSLQRVSVEVREGPIEDAQIAVRFAQQDQMLCIVNTRSHARDLFEQIRSLPGARHLTTLMCAAHRQQVLQEIRQDLAAKKPVRLVATSLIEAGVDVDFAEVWRAETGLDSVAQAAGRCNREGRLETGRVVVFTPAAHDIPKNFRVFRDAARLPLQMPDKLGPAAINRYFQELYFAHGYEGLDTLMIDEQKGILPAIKRAQMNMMFDSIAQSFRLIDDSMRSVIVPWKETEDDLRAANMLASLRAAPVPPRAVLQTLQRYVVPVPESTWRTLRANGGIQPVSETYGERFMVVSEGLYDEICGLKTEDERALIF